MAEIQAPHLKAPPVIVLPALGWFLWFLLVPLGIVVVYSFITKGIYGGVVFHFTGDNYLRATPREEIDPPPLITGDDLVAMGLTPGAQFKELLDRVRDAQLDGTISTKNEALALVHRLVGRT